MYFIHEFRNISLFSKVLFIINVPLVILFLPLCFIYYDNQGVLLQGIDYFQSTIIFIVYWILLIFLKNDKRVILSNLTIQTVLCSELRGYIPFVFTGRHCETLTVEIIVISCYILACLLFELLYVIYYIAKYLLDKYSRRQ